MDKRILFTGSEGQQSIGRGFDASYITASVTKKSYPRSLSR
uniref:Uncharacterized protein n=1 Tax=Rhizophora mucronata TaxID=61149 RepID=A0A2P2PUF7_RHIMU